MRTFCASEVVGGALVALAGLVASNAAAQSYTLSNSSGSLVSIASTGTPVTLSSTDDGNGSFSAPFSFPFFGTTVSAGSTLFVNSNGTLDIDSANTSYSNTTIPSSSAPNGFVAPFWTDLLMDGGGIYYAVQGSSPSRVLVVEWTNAKSYAQPSETATWQVRIREGSGVIELLYGPRVGGSTWAGTVGIENSSGSYGLGVACGAACALTDLPQGTLLVFTPSTAPPPVQEPNLAVGWVSTVPTSVREGDYLSIDIEVDNTGTGPAGAFDAVLYVGYSPTVTTNDLELAYASFSGIGAGSSGSATLSGTVPSGSAGTYYAAIIVDPWSYVTESNESDNTYALGPIVVTGGGGGGQITVMTRQLPTAQIGQYYETQLQQSGASYPYWTIISGSPPPGVNLSTSGVLSGTPSVQGVYNFQVQAEEEGLVPGTASLSVSVNNGGGGGFVITTESLPPAHVGVPYQASVSASGGTPPYAFQVISGRPEWLLLASDGSLSGTPDATGNHQLVVSVFDSESQDASAVLVLDVTHAGPLALSTSALVGVQNRAMRAPAIVGGIPPYNVTVTQGQLPDDLAIGADGYLTGFPTSSGSWTIEVSVTDSASPQGSAQGGLQVNVTELRPLAIPRSEIVLYVKTDLNHQMVAEGGVPPYRWNIVWGALPAGAQLNGEAGTIIGRLEEVSTTTVTFAVQDAEGTTIQSDVLVKAIFQRNQGTTSRAPGRGGCSCSTHATVPTRPIFPWIVLLALSFSGLRVLRVRRFDLRARPRPEQRPS